MYKNDTTSLYQLIFNYSVRAVKQHIYVYGEGNLKNLATQHEYLIGQQKHVTVVSLAVT